MTIPWTLEDVRDVVEQARAYDAAERQLATAGDVAASLDVGGRLVRSLDRLARITDALIADRDAPTAEAPGATADAAADALAALQRELVAAHDALAVAQASLQAAGGGRLLRCVDGPRDGLTLPARDGHTWIGYAGDGGVVTLEERANDDDRPAGGYALGYYGEELDGSLTWHPVIPTHDPAAPIPDRLRGFDLGAGWSAAEDGAPADGVIVTAAALVPAPSAESGERFVRLTDGPLAGRRLAMRPGYGLLVIAGHETGALLLHEWATDAAPDEMQAGPESVAFVGRPLGSYFLDGAGRPEWVPPAWDAPDGLTAPPRLLFVSEGPLSGRWLALRAGHAWAVARSATGALLLSEWPATVDEAAGTVRIERSAGADLGGTRLGSYAVAGDGCLAWAPLGSAPGPLAELYPLDPAPPSPN